MATITRRKRGYQAEVRRKGFPTVSRMFDSRKEAEAWARMHEGEMDRGIYVSRKEAESTTLAEALERYELEVTSTKKGAPRERYRLKAWKKHPLAACYLASIRSTDVAQYRDTRLALGAAANTVRLELTLLSHVFTIAIKEWGMESLRNPVALIRLPSRPLGRERRVGHERELAGC
ncbi:MAG: Shufflon-specific DNA recombinase [Betaproteobacteria bacterium]|nr:Shufflon-specific DNA recombinase [Betaproteobacteria bacterium]